MLAALVTFLLLVIPAHLFAKGERVRITIKGADLKMPIETTDLKTLANFNVWTGPGTSWTGPDTSSKQADRFIIDWSQGAVTDRPRDFHATKCPCTRNCRMSDSSMWCSTSMIRRWNAVTLKA
jgi:hypothetical protein